MATKREILQEEEKRLEQLWRNVEVNVQYLPPPKPAFIPYKLPKYNPPPTSPDYELTHLGEFMPCEFEFVIQLFENNAFYQSVDHINSTGGFVMAHYVDISHDSGLLVGHIRFMMKCSKKWFSMNHVVKEISHTIKEMGGCGEVVGYVHPQKKTSLFEQVFQP